MKATILALSILLIPIAIMAFIFGIVPALIFTAIYYAAGCVISSFFLLLFNKWKIDDFWEFVKASLLWPLSLVFILALLTHR